MSDYYKKDQLVHLEKEKEEEEEDIILKKIKKPISFKILLKRSFFPFLYSILSTITYVFIHLLSKYICIKIFGKEKWLLFPKKIQIYLPEKICSSINGLILGLSGLYFFIFKKFWKNNIWTPYSPFIDYIFSSYVGYTLYDLIIMITVGGEPLNMWIHHIFGLLGAFLSMLYKIGIFFPFVVSISELTVLFTNIIWIFQKFSLIQHPIYFYLQIIRNISFLLCRTFIAPITLLYGIKETKNQKTGKIDIQLFKKRYIHMPWLLKWGIAFNVTLFGGLNFYWTFIAIYHIIKKKK